MCHHVSHVKSDFGLTFIIKAISNCSSYILLYPTIPEACWVYTPVWLEIPMYHSQLQGSHKIACKLTLQHMEKNKEGFLRKTI